MEEELQKQAAEAAAKAQVEGSKSESAYANQDSDKSALERRGEQIIKGDKASQVEMVEIPAHSQVEAAKLAAQAQEYSAKMQVEAAEISADAQSDVAYQNRKASELQAEAQKYIADKSLEGVKAQADASVEVSGNQLKAVEVKSDADIKIAQTAADADIKVAQIDKSKEVLTSLINNLSEDGRTLDANEIKVLSILQKYGFENFVDKESFINSLDVQREETKLNNFLNITPSRSDAKQLEKALKGDGKLLKADGKIDQETLLAINAMVLENIIPASATLGVDALGNLVSQNGINPEMLNDIKGILGK